MGDKQSPIVASDLRDVAVAANKLADAVSNIGFWTLCEGENGKVIWWFI